MEFRVTNWEKCYTVLIDFIVVQCGKVWLSTSLTEVNIAKVKIVI